MIEKMEELSLFIYGLGSHIIQEKTKTGILVEDSDKARMFVGYWAWLQYFVQADIN